MPDYIGRIEVPEVSPSGTFPIVSDWGYGHALQPPVAIHTIDNFSANLKIEQRFLLGVGMRRFIVRRAALSEPERQALRDFWEARKGAYQPFTYNAPNDGGSGTTAYVVRFENAPISWEYLSDSICSTGIMLIEQVGEAPTYPLNATQERFPSGSLPAALLAQAQEIIPLVKIRVREAAVNDIFLSDRRCTIGSQLYQARLLTWGGISQEIGGASDQARFTFGNADRVMRDLAADTSLDRAMVEFSLYHVGTGIKLDLWKGHVVDWSSDAGPEFGLAASDGAYELGLAYPKRTVSRDCWKPFKDGSNCPYVGGDTFCDKGFATAAGCQSHGMDPYFGGVVAKPQGVALKTTPTYGLKTLSRAITATSQVADTIYGEVIPEVYNYGGCGQLPDAWIEGFPVNCLMAAGREEMEFYDGLGIVSEGPISAFGTIAYEHRIDGEPPHGFNETPPKGIRTSLGADPNPDPFGLTSIGSPDPAERVAGTAFIELRRVDAKGLQLSRITEHKMRAVVFSGMGGWTWSGGARSWSTGLTNPIWIAVNALLRGMGMMNATKEQQEAVFDVVATEAAGAVCNLGVPKIIGTGDEVQYRFRGMIAEQKPLRDWLQEILNNCLGYFTFAFGKFRPGIRYHSGVAETFTAGNILRDSLQLSQSRPAFNRLQAAFGDEEYQFARNVIEVGDIDHAVRWGSATGPLWLKNEINLCGAPGMSQAARIVSTRLREELGGITEAEQRAARMIRFRTTVLALAVEPGMICSMTHADMPGGTGEFRITGWRLNGDYSIEVWGSSTTDSMYDLTAGPKPADVTPDPLPEEDFTIPDVTVFKAGQQQEDGSFLSTMAWDVLRPDWLKFDWAAMAPAERTYWTGIGIWIELPDGTQHDHTGLIPFADFARIATGEKFMATGTIAIEPASVPDPPENWKIICVSYGVDGQPKRSADGKVTGKSVTLATLTRWGKLTNLAASVAEYGWDETTEPSKPVARINITYTNPDHADADTYFDFWIYTTGTGVTSPPDAGKFSYRASMRWETGRTDVDIWVDRPAVGEATERIWVRAVVCGRYYSGAPNNESPVCYVDVTAPGAAAQVTGFSLTRNDLASPAKLFTVSVNFTRPVDPEFWYALVERIPCDSGYNPLPGAEWEHFMEVGAYATPGVPTSELAVRDGHVYPTAAPEYWKMRARSASRAGIFNDTAPPTANLYIPTETTIEGSKVVNIPTASFASGIRPVILVASLPGLPDALYPAGTVAYHTGEVRLYKVNAAGNAWVYAVDGGKDIVADSITAGQIAAGAIRTEELYAGEILVGQGGGKPTRFKVVDSGGSMIGFIGDDPGIPFLGAYLKNLKVGPSINNINLEASGAGLSITDAAITVTKPGSPSTVITISPTVGIEITSGSYLATMLQAEFKASYGSSYSRLWWQGVEAVPSTGLGYSGALMASTSGGELLLSADSAVKVDARAYGTYGPYINVAGYYAVSGVTVIGTTRVGYLTALYVDGSGSPASRVALTGGASGGLVEVTDTAYATRAKLSVAAGYGGLALLDESGNVVVSGSAYSGLTYALTVAMGKGIQVGGDINGLAGLQMDNLPSSSPGAGTKKLWYDASDGNTVKFAA